MIKVGHANGEYTFECAREEYGLFQNPVGYIYLNDKLFTTKDGDMIVGEIHVELTAGLEASVASFRVLDVFNMDTGKFDYDKVGNQIRMGNSVRIELGYLDTVETVFVGFISGVAFGFAPNEVPYIEVTAMDVKGLMIG